MATDIERLRAEQMAVDAEVRLISEDGVLENRLYLVRNNIPFDVAFSLDNVTARGWALQFARMDGHDWDWDSGTWKKKGGDA